jgi:hypothetical protein
MGSLQRHYERIIFEDGISRKEARTIAMKAYLKNEHKNYRVGSAMVYEGHAILKSNSDLLSRDLYAGGGKLRFPDSWHVLFRPKFLNLFSRYYLIVIDKKDGSVLYEHESNVFGDLFESIFKVYLEPRLICAAAVVIFYKDKKEVPESVEVLKLYLAQSPEAKEMANTGLDGMRLEKISANKLKVSYVSTGFDKADKDPSGVDKLFSSAYDLELETKGEKIVMKISGDYVGTLEFSGSPVEQSLSPAITP